MTKIKRDQLVAAAKDLNKVLGLEPPINTNTTKEKELVTALSEVVDMIDETDEIKDSTREVLVQLGFIQPDVEDVDDDESEEEDEADAEVNEDVEELEQEEDEDVEPTPPTIEELKELISESNSTKELKEIIKREAELFEGFTPSAKVKNVIDLRTAMLDFLEKDDVVKEQEEEEEVKLKNKRGANVVKKEVVEKENTLLNTRIACMTHVMLQQPKLSKDEQIKIADKLFCTESGKSSNIKEQAGQWQRVNNVLAVVNYLQNNE